MNAITLTTHDDGHCVPHLSRCISSKWCSSQFITNKMIRLMMPTKVFFIIKMFAHKNTTFQIATIQLSVHLMLFILQSNFNWIHQVTNIRTINGNSPQNNLNTRTNNWLNWWQNLLKWIGSDESSTIVLHSVFRWKFTWSATQVCLLFILKIDLLLWCH